jgi:alcohol dehydrogenase
VERGSIKPIIHAVYPLAESREAMRVMEDREVFGKILVKP